MQYPTIKRMIDYYCIYYFCEMHMEKTHIQLGDWKILNFFFKIESIWMKNQWKPIGLIIDGRQIKWRDVNVVMKQWNYIQINTTQAQLSYIKYTSQHKCFFVQMLTTLLCVCKIANPTIGVTLFRNSYARDERRKNTYTHTLQQQ